MSHQNDPSEDARAEQLAWVRTTPKAPIPTPSPYPMIRFAEPAHPFDRPVRVEADIDGLECVQGAIPAHLDGTYYKVVSDRQFPSFVENDLGYFNDDGMALAFRFHDGKVTYKSRFIRTPRFQAERAAGRSLFGKYRNQFDDDAMVEGMLRGNANTNLFFHGGKLYAAKEDSPPIILDPDTLDTLGVYDFEGSLTSKSSTAHPKVDPLTGEMVFFGYAAKGDTTRDIAYYEADSTGQIIHETWFKAPYSAMVHDFAVTQNYVIFPIIPLRSEREWIEEGKSAFQWDASEDVYLGVIPRKGDGAGIRWFRGRSRFSSHILGAFDDGRYIYIDSPVSESKYFPWFPNMDGSPHDPVKGQTTLTRWTIDLHDGADGFTESQISKLGVEFPRMDDRFETMKHTWGAMAVSAVPGIEVQGHGFRWISTIDYATGEQKLYYPGDGSTVGEPVFVPGSANAPEGHGYVFVLVSRRDAMHSDLVVLDAQNIDKEPVCTLRMPLRVPKGLHGNWVSAEELAQRTD